MSLILSVLFGQHGLLSTETKERATADLIKAGQTLGIVPTPPRNGSNHTGGREEVDIHFPAHDARRRFVGEPSLRATHFEGEPEEDDKTNKPSREDEAKIHNILTELAGGSTTTIATTTTTTASTSTEYTWHATEWELNQVEEQIRDKRAVRTFQSNTNTYDVTTSPNHKQGKGMLQPSQKCQLTTAISTLLLIMGVHILVTNSYPEEIKSHIVTHCNWISSDTLQNELNAKNPTCRIFREGRVFLHCTNPRDNTQVCQLPVDMNDQSKDALSLRANLVGRALNQAGLGLNPNEDDDYTPVRRQLQEKVDKIYRGLQNDDQAVAAVEEELIIHGQAAAKRVQSILRDQPELAESIDRSTVEVFTWPDGEGTKSPRHLDDLSVNIMSYLSLWTPQSKDSTENTIGVRRAAMFLNEFMKDSGQDSWEQGLEDLWDYFYQQEDLTFGKEELLTAINQLEENTLVQVFDEEESEEAVEVPERARRSGGVMTSWQPVSHQRGEGLFDGQPRSQALSRNDKWDNMRHGMLVDDGSGPNPKCGPNSPDAPPGRTMECDRFSSRPCCSGIGYCGFSRNHCSCHYCQDYRPSNYNEVRRARGLPEMTEWWQDSPHHTYSNESLVAKLQLPEGGNYADATGPDIRFSDLDSLDQDVIKEAIRTGRKKALLRMTGTLGRKWDIVEEHEGTVSWTHERTVLEYEDTASVVIVEDLGPTLNALDRIVDYHKKNRVSFTSDPENASHRNSPIYYSNLGVRSPHSLYNVSSNTSLFHNLSQGIGQEWSEDQQYSRVSFWAANDAIIESAAREAGICLELILEAIELFHPDLDEESKGRMKRQVISLLLAGVGAVMGLAGLGSGISAVSQSAQNYASIQTLSTRLNSVQAGVYTISKRQEIELTTEHAILKAIDDMAGIEKEDQRESLALVSQNLLNQSKNKACKRAEDTVRHLETLRKNTLPLGMVNQELLEGALNKIKSRSMAVGLFPAVNSMTDFLKLRTKSLIVRTGLTDNEKKDIYEDHLKAVENLGLKKYYEDNNITTALTKNHLENHHNNTGQIVLDADGPGVYHPERVLLEIKSDVPLIRAGQEVFYVRSLELGLIKVVDRNTTNYFTLNHDDWVAVSRSGNKMFQLRKEYFDDCMQNQDHYVCPRAPRPSSDDCLVNLLAGREDTKCLKRMIALDGSRPYLVRSEEDDRTALAYVPNNFNVVLRCPAPSRIAANLTLEWARSRDDPKGLIKLTAPFLYCSVHLAKNGEPHIGPSVYFLPRGQEERVYLKEKTTMKDLYTLLGLFDATTGQLKADTGYSRSYLEAKEFLERANVSMGDIDRVQQLMPWDLLKLDQSSVKLAVSIATISAALCFSFLCLCGWYYCRKNAKKTARVRESLNRDRAMRQASSEAQAQALLNRNTVRFV